MSAVKHTRPAMPRIVNISRLFIPRHYAERFHADADNELLHIIGGSMRLLFESGEEYTAGKNDTLLIPRGVRHKDIFEVRQGLEMFHINFKWSAGDRFFAAASPDCLKKLLPKDRHELLLLLDMFRLDGYQSPDNVVVADARLAHLLAIAWRHVFAPAAGERAVGDTYSRLAARADEYMKAHLSEHINIDSVAAVLKVSRATLLRAFHHAADMSFNARLRTMRMHEAYALLRERALNLGECALRCGYSDPGYFSKSFKKHFGFSPKNIR